MDTARIRALPFIDEHTTLVPADAGAVWHALGMALDRSFSGGGSAALPRLLGCADRTPSGPRPLTEGSTLRGFRVATATPDHELTLVGRHRFARYALIFRLEETGENRTRLRAETRATFPGPAGALYRALLMGTGAHNLAVRRMLRTVRESAPKGREELRDQPQRTPQPQDEP